MVRSSFVVLPLLAAAAASVSATQTAPPPRHRSWLQVVAMAAGGAVLGGWAGYVTSQVAWSDWQEGEGRGAHRVRFSVTGAALGLLAGALIGSRRTEAGPPPMPSPLVAPPTTPSPISAEEIRASSARTVTELLRQLRPQWLRSRGRDLLRLNDDPLAVPGVRVYLNGGLLGGLHALDQVSIDAVTEVQFLDAAAAMLRWGAGHHDGVILLTTAAAP